MIRRAGLSLAAALCLIAADAGRDFSGKWVLDRAASKPGQLSSAGETITVTQSSLALECESAGAQWSIPLDGGDSRNQVGGERWNTASKWEGQALLVNTLVRGAREYTIMERWRLWPDGSLHINRQVLRGAEQTEGELIYRHPGAPAGPAAAPVLSRRPEGAVPAEKPAGREYVVPAGTRVLLSLVRSVSTKFSNEGDPVYLETAFPVTIEGRTVIPKGSTVTGVVSNSKRPGKVAGKGDLYIRFEQLVLLNGTTRDFRSRLGSADGGTGEVDRNEGSVRGPGNKAGDAKTVGTGAGAGAGLGGVIGRSAGSTGIGAAAGAAAGLATVLMRRGPDPTLPAGTQVEMVLDRDLRFRADELMPR